MADTAASVLARLKNKGKETGMSYQLCLQLFCQEEFLRRLEKSQYAENLVLKGGLFIYSITGFDSRVTVDVDFLLRKVPNTPEKLKKVLEEISATPTGNDFVTFEITNIAPIAQNYQKNSYRVLLTRARQGYIIYVPKGNVEDATRNPKYYDQTYNYLKKIGVIEI